MVSGETSPNAATVRPFSLFTSHMKQERTKCQPHPIHRLSVQGKDTFYQKRIRRARGTALRKKLVCSEKEFLLHDMGEWKGMMGRIFGGFLCCSKRPNYD